MSAPTDKPWRVYRFEHEPTGKYAEVASNEVGPNKIPLPPGYKFVSSTELVPVSEYYRLQAAIDAAAGALRDSAYVGGLSERDAWAAALTALGPHVTEHTATGDA